MILLANILSGLGQALSMLLSFFTIVVLLRALISWVNPDPMNGFVRFLSASTDPLINPLRRVVPPLGNIDITPLILFFLLMFLDRAIAGSLVDYAAVMRMKAMTGQF